MSTIADATMFFTASIGAAILLKGTILVTLGLAAAGLARRRRAALRHLLLAATFATLLTLPALVLLGPSLPVEIPILAVNLLPGKADSAPPAAITAPPAPGTTHAAPVSGSSGLSWPSMALYVWMAGAALLLARAGFDLWQVRRTVRHGLPWMELRHKAGSLAANGVRRPVEVMRHEDVAAPFTCGVWRPAVVFPAAAFAWSDADLERALVHELEHVRRRDWAVHLAARVACVCYWFHPLVWVAWRRLCLEAERACDDAVVRRYEHADYAEQLVTMAQRMSAADARPVLGMANRSDLAGRVQALLDSSQQRGRAGALAAAGAICMAAVAGSAIAPLRIVAAPIPAPGEVSQPAQTHSTQVPKRIGPFDIALYEASSDGDTGAIVRLLDAGADVNAAVTGDGSPLIGAARQGHLNAVRLLLERGADPDMGVPGDGNPLIMAAREGHADVVTLLLDRGASIEQVVPGDENALIQASGNGHLEIVRLLVSRGASVNARVWAPRGPVEGEWRTPLGVAFRNRHAAVVDFLRSAGAVENGNTPLNLKMRRENVK
jgi:beta-lactamase regulating signal transducer with metallopeptidase domain